MQMYLMNGIPAIGNDVTFLKVTDAVETSTAPAGHIVARSAADLGLTPPNPALVADDVGDMPVYLAEIPDGQTPGDMPAFYLLPGTTPVYARLVSNAAHTAEYGSASYLLSLTGPNITKTLDEVCFSEKGQLAVDCALTGPGYDRAGGLSMCFGRANATTEGDFRVKDLVVDDYHVDFTTTLRFSGSIRLPLHTRISAAIAGTHGQDVLSTATTDPAIGSIAALGDTPCP